MGNLPSDPAECVALADAGDVEAQLCVGATFWNAGIEKGGVKRNEVTATYFAHAFNWVQRAALQGDARAQFRLARCYRLGWGVAQSFAEAHRWNRRAAEGGNAEAQCAMADGCEDEVECASWYLKAAEQGNTYGQLMLGRKYLKGAGVPMDCAAGAEWFRKAAELGRANAQYELGMLYLEGRGVPQDLSLAIDWLRKAAEQGDPDAQEHLGLLYRDGQGVPQSYVEAWFWLTLSNPISQKKVATMDAVKAKLSWGERSAVKGRVQAWSREHQQK